MRVGISLAFMLEYFFDVEVKDQDNKSGLKEAEKKVREYFDKHFYRKDCNSYDISTQILDLEYCLKKDRKMITIQSCCICGKERHINCPICGKSLCEEHKDMVNSKFCCGNEINFYKW